MMSETAVDRYLHLWVKNKIPAKYQQRFLSNELVSRGQKASLLRTMPWILVSLKATPNVLRFAYDKLCYFLSNALSTRNYVSFTSTHLNHFWAKLFSYLRTHRRCLFSVVMTIWSLAPWKAFDKHHLQNPYSSRLYLRLFVPFFATLLSSFSVVSRGPLERP